MNEVHKKLGKVQYNHDVSLMEMLSKLLKYLTDCHSRQLLYGLQCDIQNSEKRVSVTWNP